MKSSIFSKVVKFGKKCIKFLWAVCLLIILLFYVIILLFSAIILNPLLFYLLSLIFPKTMGRFIHKIDDEDSIWSVIVSENLLVFPLFPWYVKKRFCEINLDWASTDMLIRYLLEIDNDNEQKAFLSQLKQCQLDNMYKEGCDKVKILIIPYINAVKLEHIVLLMDNKLYNVVKKKIDKTTLSDSVLGYLLESTYFEYNAYILSQLCAYVRINGLSTKLISQLSENAYAKVKNDLDFYQSYQFAKAIASKNSYGTWANFCQKTKDFPYGAQYVMTGWMYDDFRKAGHKLSNKAIIHYLLEQSPLAQSVIQYEDCSDEKVQKIINSNTQYRFWAIDNN